MKTDNIETIPTGKPFEVKRSKFQDRYFDEYGRHYATHTRSKLDSYIAFTRTISFGELQNIYINIEL